MHDKHKKKKMHETYEGMNLFKLMVAGTKEHNTGSQWSSSGQQVGPTVVRAALTDELAKYTKYFWLSLVVYMLLLLLAVAACVYTSSWSKGYRFASMFFGNLASHVGLICTAANYGMMAATKTALDELG